MALAFLTVTFVLLDLIINIKIHDDNPTQQQLYGIIYRIIGQNVLYVTLGMHDSNHEYI